MNWLMLIFDAEGKLTRKTSPMCIFRQTVRYTNQIHKGNLPHIDRITSMVHNGVCAPIIDQDEVLSRVMLSTMWISNTLGDVLLAQYMDE